MGNNRRTAEKLLKYYEDYSTRDAFVAACLNTLLLGHRGAAELAWEVIDVMEERREGDDN